jgi:uncharacterized protein YggE
MIRIISISLCITICLLSNVVGQDIPKLEVTGNAQTMVKPDLAILNANISSIELEYDDAIKALSNKTNKLKKQLTKLKFNENEIKTTNFSVRKNYKYKKGERIDSGFVASHAVRVEFPYDKERLTKVITALGVSEAEANMQFEFGLSNSKKKEVEADLIKDAIEDAKRKATIIESSAELKLQNIINIQYHGGGEQAPVYRYQAAARMEADNSEPTIDAKEILMRQEIQVVWAIE